MALVTLDVFKPYMGVTRADDLLDDDVLSAAVAAAESAVRTYTGRNIEVAGTPATARKFIPRWSRTLKIDDCTTVTVVDDYGSVLTIDQYQLEPLNQLEDGEYRPYSEIRRAGGWYESWDSLASVTVTATWGWATIPAPVKEAVKILAKDVVKMRDVSFGIAGFTDYAGVRARENPMVAALLRPYRKSTGIG